MQVRTWKLAVATMLFKQDGSKVFDQPWPRIRKSNYLSLLPIAVCVVTLILIIVTALTAFTLQEPAVAPRRCTVAAAAAAARALRPSIDRRIIRCTPSTSTVPSSRPNPSKDTVATPCQDPSPFVRGYGSIKDSLEINSYIAIAKISRHPTLSILLLALIFFCICKFRMQ